MSVRTNADTPEQTQNAIAFGAVGIGLCRTEHMFFEGDRIDAMREMILAETLEARKAALAKLLPYQRDDFAGIFRALKGYPATIRFLDPPLHEFLPHTPEQQAGPGEEARRAGRDDSVARRAAARVQPDARLPRLPPRHRLSRRSRRCRRAPCSRPRRSSRRKGIKVKPEIMIPLVGFKKELDLQLEVVHQAARDVQAEQKVKLNYLVGTMIEVPRGALTADEIAQSAEFFSFGTNDLTQTGLGMSRDDSGSFLPTYAELEIVKKNPFATIDQTGVGQLVEIAVTQGARRRGRTSSSASAASTAAIPSSIHFFEKVGLDYVSCSPFRVPVARLAAAQAALSMKAEDDRDVWTLRDHRLRPSERQTTMRRTGSSPSGSTRPRGVTLWVDLAAPTDEERRLLSDVFHFHPLSVEDAAQRPAVPEDRDRIPGYLYLVLHGIDCQAAAARSLRRATSTSSSAATTW